MAIIKGIKSEIGVEAKYWNIKRAGGSQKVRYSVIGDKKFVDIIMSGWLDEEAYRTPGTEPVIREYKPNTLEIPHSLNFRDELIYGFLQCSDERFFNAISDVNVEYDAEELKHLLDAKTKTINKIKDRKIMEIKKTYENVPPTIKVETEELEPVTINGKEVYDSNGVPLMQKVVASQPNPDYQACLDNIELVENYANELISQMQIGQDEMFAVEWSD